MRPAALAAALSLAACTAGGDGSNRGNGNQPTLPPASAFKDVLLAAAVKTKLAGVDIDSTTRVHVQVHDGRAILTGRVPNLIAKQRAVSAARTVQGITGVDDRLGVGNAGPSASQTAKDLGVAAAVEAALVAQAGINVTGVKVTASGGVVTLQGHAPTDAVKSTMLGAAKKTPGVRNVVDRIAVR
ncbi:MAG: BON domain-containing protein [Candidatus Velthaea sp.]